MKPAYELIEEYNNLSEEDKKEFKMLFDRVMALEEHDAKVKKQEKILAVNALKEFLKEDETPYFHTDYLLSILGLSDDDMNENKKHYKK